VLRINLVEHSAALQRAETLVTKLDAGLRRRSAPAISDSSIANTGNVVCRRGQKAVVS
jgi:hypothetical protein